MRPSEVTRDFAARPQRDSKMRFAGQRSRLLNALRRAPLGMGELLSGFCLCPASLAGTGFKRARAHHNAHT
eukprot:10963951-Alexandrium_andersonii.AAC.1